MFTPPLQNHVFKMEVMRRRILNTMVYLATGMFEFKTNCAESAEKWMNPLHGFGGAG